ncbi:hypothetical protein [Paraliobacillus salinarum]|uniref:hypothetical protein n=1 Tax=Paraliobacillus salinarum TaxID=1158996 RepID=UPI0015F3BDAA|nr:hypothetical protein [Paraliobacillus salinarum]
MENIVGILTLLIAIGGGLLGWFGQNEDEDSKKTSFPFPNQKKPQAPNNHPKKENPTVDYSETYFDEKQAQLDHLKSTMDIDYDQMDLPAKENIGTVRKANKEVKVNKRKTSLSIGKNISKEGLAESVIMAEVLGPPRAKKPYQRKIYK